VRAVAQSPGASGGGGGVGEERRKHRARGAVACASRIAGAVLEGETERERDGAGRMGLGPKWCLPLFSLKNISNMFIFF
jgi:hypothetical protein